MSKAAVVWIEDEAVLRQTEKAIQVENARGETVWLPVSQKLDWVVIGGESGPGARPFTLGWGKGLIRQCQAAGVPVFMKQLGAVPVNCEGERCPHIRDPKGGDMAEWPEDLRVREWPRG